MEPLLITDAVRILKNIVELGIPAITWSGGEALLYGGLTELARIAHENGIVNRLITNGQRYDAGVFRNLNELVISVDSVDEECNVVLGRGKTHFDRVLDTMRKIRDECPLPIRINTMISSRNTERLKELYDFIIEHGVSKWRISKFAPLRGRAKENGDFFSISNEDFIALLEKIATWNTGNQVILETRQDEDFERRYILITPNGSIVVTKDNADMVLGDARNIEVLRANTLNINWQL
jgi:MoaA/NifB/PqqE/SkfB family radical SAM enzyme